jgi:hypothetical protein
MHYENETTKQEVQIEKIFKEAGKSNEWGEGKFHSRQ